MKHYKIYLLGKENNVVKTIFFDGSNNTIHLDDSVRIIKNKILKELGLTKVSYKELYLFTKNTFQDSLLNVYRFLTNQDTEILTVDKIKIFLANIDKTDLITKISKESYTYDDFLNIMGENKDLNIYIPIGQKFEKTYDYLFWTNPFNTKHIDNKKHNLLSFENSLLLNYGEIHDDSIYVCLAEDIFSYAEKENLNMDYITQYYYPFLYKDQIKSLSSLLEKKEYLIEETNNTITDKTWKLYKTIDLFYDIYNNKTSELSYNKMGITSFKLVINTNFKNVLPLDTIFKNIHATKQIPFIKYNPGFRMENLYRLYSEKISTNGKKIPFLKNSEILRLSRDLGKLGQISLFIRDQIKGKYNFPIELIMNFNKDGNIYIQSTLQTPLPLYDDQFERKKYTLETLLQNFLNPILDNLNGSLFETGYQIQKIRSLNDIVIDVESINYYYELNISKKIDLNKYIGCLSSIFTIENSDLTADKGAVLRFKRVENYQEMDGITLFIHNEYNKTHDVENVIYELTKQMGLSEDEAREQVIRFFGEHVLLQGKLLENNGFMVYMKLFQAENKLEIRVDEIKSLKYIEIISIYLDSILRIFQEPTTSPIITDFQSMCKKSINYDNVDKSNFDIIVAPKEETVKNIVKPVVFSEVYEDFFETEPPINDDEINIIVKQKIENEEKGIEDEDDILFGMDIDEEYEPEEIEADVEGGGENDKIEINVEGKPLKNPNPFQDKIEKLDPNLILKSQQGKYNPYSKTCPPAVLRQPIILTDEEKEYIDNNHPGSYSTAVHYGSNPDKKYWYICPRYWSFKDNSSLTEEEVKEILKTNPKAIIPNKAKTIPKGSYIYEFNSSKEHMDEKGNYITHYPGLQKGKHPEYELPCCFKKEQKIDDIEKTKRVITYVISSNSYPVPKSRWGYLPLPIQKLFQIDNMKCASKLNVAMIQANTPCLLRFGVENNEMQSFIACFADIYAYEKNLKIIPTISEMRTILAKSISIDIFIKSHNGSLFSIFRPQIDDKSLKTITINKYSSSIFYNELDKTKKEEVELFEEIVLSYENFLKYITDENVYIDHTYLWDIITQPNPNLIKDGLNLAIFSIINDSVEILCPTSSNSESKFNPSKYTFLLIKQDDYYEPIYLYEGRNNKYYNQKLFHNKSKNVTVQNVINTVMQISSNCRHLSSLPKLYHFKNNLYPNEMIPLLKKYNYNIHLQVINYQTKIVGFIVSNGELGTKFFIPCIPSAIIDSIKTIFIDKINNWNPMDVTINELTSLHSKTNGQIKCLPKIKVVDDNLIVGIITEANQYIRIEPPIENTSIIENNMDIKLKELQSHDYIEADKLIFTRSNYDNKRKIIIRNIRLESKFYRIFRSTIRTLLSYYEYRHIKHQIMDLLENPTFSYKQKIYKIENILKKLVGDIIIFKEMNEDNLDYLANDVYFNEYIQCKNCDSHKLCSQITENKCQISIPFRNLTIDIENEKLYYGKISDELLRFSRIRSFILEPVYYLNLTNINYKINNDEVLLLDSTIKSENFSDLRIFNFNNYIKNITYDNAENDETISQNYSNKIQLDSNVNI